MNNIIKFLENNGASLSSDIAKAVSAQTGEKPASVRRKISRECLNPNSLIARIDLNFPHREGFIYLKSQGFDKDFYDNLKDAANKTNSAYSYILNAFDCANGVLDYNKAYILSGSPLRIKGHIGCDAIINNLKKYNLCYESNLNENIYLNSQNANTQIAIAQMKVETHLIEMLKDWIVKNSFTSSGVINKDNDYANFKWDITAPSFLYFIRNKEKPGFIVIDVIYNTVNENTIKYFINKINIAKNLKNVQKAIPILVAKYFTPEALNLAKQQGIIATTPNNLFGNTTAKLFEDLLNVLINAGSIAATDFSKFMALFDKLNEIKGSALNLAGDLFEFIVGHCYKTIEGGSLDIGRIIKYDGKEKEIDVILRTDKNIQYYLECKGYGQSHLVNIDEIKEWLQKITFIRQWYDQHHSDGKKPHFNFGFITTSDFTDDAKKLLNERETAQKIQIFHMNGKDFVNFIRQHEINNATKIINVLKEHYLTQEI